MPILLEPKLVESDWWISLIEFFIDSVDWKGQWMWIVEVVVDQSADCPEAEARHGQTRCVF
ncbi:hypothetical protein N7453_002617 [Penicillium expansum]|nr:hypothetical protein N7453_002617 [Penicillium expansum]